MTTYIDILKDAEGLVEDRYVFLAADMDTILMDSNWGVTGNFEPSSGLPFDDPRVDDGTEIGFEPSSKTFRYYGVDITKENFLEAIEKINDKIIDRVINSEKPTQVSMNNIVYTIKVQENERTIYMNKYPSIGKTIINRKDLVEFFNDSFRFLGNIILTTEMFKELVDEYLFEWDEITWNYDHGFVVHENHDYKVELYTDKSHEGYLLYDKLKDEYHLLYEGLTESDIFDKLAIYKFLKRVMDPMEFFHMKSRINIRHMKQYEKKK